MTALAESVVADLRDGHTGGWPAIAVGQLADATGDPGLIRKVWEHLIGNAVKFSANRADAAVSVESQVTAGEAIYHVRDNGVGFDMTYAGKLFGVFQRLHPGRVSRHGHRPGHRRPHRGPPGRQSLGRRPRRRRRMLLLYPAGRFD